MYIMRNLRKGIQRIRKLTALKKLTVEVKRIEKKSKWENSLPAKSNYNWCARKSEYYL